jgi:hypothetical protein
MKQDARYTALVLAANRGGPQDPLAAAGGVSHKTFIDIAGEPMLRRVVRSVLDCGRVGRIIVSIEPGSMEEAREILAPLSAQDRISFTPSAHNIGASVTAAVGDDTSLLPLIITTGDNALHTPELVRYYCDSLDEVEADGALGLTPASYVLEKYPEGNRAFHRFRDGAFSSCNLYAFLKPQAISGAKVFNSGGQFAKRPKRIIGAFGVVAFLLYKSRMLTLRAFLSILSRAIKVKTAPVLIPFAEGPIDVDRMQDWKLANRILGGGGA